MTGHIFPTIQYFGISRTPFACLRLYRTPPIPTHSIQDTAYSAIQDTAHSGHHPSGHHLFRTPHHLYRIPPTRDMTIYDTTYVFRTLPIHYSEHCPFRTLPILFRALPIQGTAYSGHCLFRALLINSGHCLLIQDTAYSGHCLFRALPIQGTAY